MTSINRSILNNYRPEFLELADAIVQTAAVLAAEAGDHDRERFGKDLTAIREAGQMLHDMAVDLFNLEGDEEPLAPVEKRLRHDMLNALTVIIGKCDEWIEDSDEEFLQGFLPDLKELRSHGRRCETLLSRIRAIQQGEAEAAADQPGACLLTDPTFKLNIGQHVEVAPTTEPGYCLVVDDNPHNRDILSRLLLRQGHRVETAIHGRDALNKIGEKPFDLVLLDIMMPELNGFQVLQHLKADQATRSLPIIMISALDDTDSVVRCIAMGAEDYLPRPFNPLLLKARIGACLEKKRFQDKEKNYLRQIEQEKKRADELLHVILPDQIVQELKTTNMVRPRDYEGVAVLFADLVGFTSYCAEHTAEEVVGPLQSLVETWENIALRYGVEKIKTIGDAFMAAAGLLVRQVNPVLNCVRCGLDMIDATHSLPGVKWNLRVGIHIGPVVAGIVGQRHYLFDLWGDTVNTAARMESNGLPGRITLTEQAWQKIAILARGDTDLVSPKGKGPLTVYRLTELL